MIVLGPKWRFHYYAHLESAGVGIGQWVTGAGEIGRVGATGNAAGKPPHLDYSIFTPFPYVWLLRTDEQGWLRMFLLDPHQKLMAR